MKIKTNFHSHTTYCDGKNTVEEMIKAAIDRKFTSFGFSGHSPLSGGEDWSMSQDSFVKYIEEVNHLKEKYKNEINVYLGIEADYLSNMTKSDTVKMGLDYMLGSVHHVVDKGGHYHSVDNTPDEYKKGVDVIGSIQAYIKDYYSSILKMIKTQNPDILGHFDLIRKFNDNGEFFNEKDKWYIDVVYNTIDEIAKTNIIMEINTGAISRGWTKYPYPSKFILERMLEKKIPIMLNSDTHSVDTIDCFFDELFKMLKDIGFKSLRVLGKDGFVDVSINEMI